MKFLALLLLLLTACDTAEAPPLKSDADTRVDAATEVVDTHQEEVLAPGYTLCDRDSELPNKGCEPGQHCETTAQVCVDCLGDNERCGPDGFERCLEPVVKGLYDLTGGLYEADPCPGSDVCVPGDNLSATCQKRACTPGINTCGESQSDLIACNAWGNETTTTKCGGGKACYEGECQNIRHNVLLIFDTSTSMHEYIVERLPPTNSGPSSCVEGVTPCWESFPECRSVETVDGVDRPGTLFEQAKIVFADVLASSTAEWSHYALQRFPQKEAVTSEALKGPEEECISGWYSAAGSATAGDVMTGDVDPNAFESGPWFAEHLGQALVVPFSRRVNVSNKPQLLEWLDFDERIGASEELCSVDRDCRDGEGACGSVNGEKRCFYHVEHELRATNQTPLGKSLYYAGEYFRKFVRVDGKACTNSVSCGSAGYVCKEGKCYDEYRHCREDHIILFTDGDENVYASPTAFFNPQIQAKRLKYGLDCASDADCRSEATCGAAGFCVAPDMLPGELADVDSDGFGALEAEDGQPITIQTTVLTLDSAATYNDLIAKAGGGPNINVQSTDPQTFKNLLAGALNRDPKCRPEER